MTRNVIIGLLIFFGLAFTRANAIDAPCDASASWELEDDITASVSGRWVTCNYGPYPFVDEGATCSQSWATYQGVSGSYCYQTGTRQLRWREVTSCTLPEVRGSDGVCYLPPCEYPDMTRDANGTCQCDEGFVPDEFEGGCYVPPDCAEKENSTWSQTEQKCECDVNYLQSIFTDTCLPLENDTDNDGIPDSQDDDIDGDGIPNADDPDIDGDGIPNGSDVTPDGGGGGGGEDTLEIEDTCRLTDINSHNAVGIGCVCNANYHKDEYGICVQDQEITHDTSCDYPPTKDGYPFQKLGSSTFYCQASINFYGGGAIDKISTCDFYGCYYKTDFSGDGNGTTPDDQDGDGIPDSQDDDQDGDGIPDGNNTDGIPDGGLFDKAKSALSNLQGKELELNSGDTGGKPITVTILNKTYTIFDPSMIDNEVWKSIALVMKWIAIIAGIITIFTTI